MILYVCSHIVVFPQFSGPLSIIFPSSVVNLHKYIWVVWFGTSKSNTSQAKSFDFVQQVVVFHDLLWLGVNNILYKDVIINYKEMANWKDEFVPRSIKDNNVLSPFNYLKSQFPALLIKAFERRVIDSNEFLLIINARHIRHSVACYKRCIESGIAIIRRVYCYYGLFFSSLLLVVVLRSDPVVVIALDKNAIKMAFLNHSSWEIDEYQFCYSCFNIFVKAGQLVNY